MAPKRKPKIPVLAYSLIFGLIFVGLIIAVVRLVQPQAAASPISTSLISSPSVNQISWDEVDKLMSDCHIKAIFQQRNLEVTLRSKSNQIYHTTQPEINAVIKLAKKYQGPCDIIQTIVTE